MFRLVLEFRSGVRVCVRGLTLNGSKITYSNQKASERVPYCSFSSLPHRAESG